MEADIISSIPFMEYPPEVRYMHEALKEAKKAEENGEVPVGAVIVHKDRIIARAYNQVEMLKDATAHAEMIALTQASASLGDWRLLDTTLYVTKEPCPMCAGAIVHARVTHVVYGVADNRGGGAGSVFNITDHPMLNHRVQTTVGVLENECRDILQNFFRRLRAKQE